MSTSWRRLAPTTRIPTRPVTPTADPTRAGRTSARAPREAERANRTPVAATGLSAFVTPGRSERSRPPVRSARRPSETSRDRAGDRCGAHDRGEHPEPGHGCHEIEVEPRIGVDPPGVPTGRNGETPTATGTASSSPSDQARPRRGDQHSAPGPARGTERTQGLDVGRVHPLVASGRRGGPHRPRHHDQERDHQERRGDDGDGVADRGLALSDVHARQVLAAIRVRDRIGERRRRRPADRRAAPCGCWIQRRSPRRSAPRRRAWSSSGRHRHHRP